jgi:hypothetical protein
VNINVVGNFNVTLVEDVIAATFDVFEAAGVRDGEVLTNGGHTVVLVANLVVVATAAVHVVLHGVPLCGDVNFNSIPVSIKKINFRFIYFVMGYLKFGKFYESNFSANHFAMM